MRKDTDTSAGFQWRMEQSESPVPQETRGLRGGDAGAMCGTCSVKMRGSGVTCRQISITMFFLTSYQFGFVRAMSEDPTNNDLVVLVEGFLPFLLTCLGLLPLRLLCCVPLPGEHTLSTALLGDGVCACVLGRAQPPGGVAGPPGESAAFNPAPKVRPRSAPHLPHARHPGRGKDRRGPGARQGDSCLNGGRAHLSEQGAARFLPVRSCARLATRSSAFLWHGARSLYRAHLSLCSGLLVGRSWTRLRRGSIETRSSPL
ncbi:hypothetical protein NDU88_007314 [Pleurodeles waltl]|uniref:Uncharacterized protein n=1 Tax=Pleurodeles waltl TaxID=8319 RepID=A0AAV7MFP6_PLEWA|nr:hypothetical protein NDU88_007314 [Pleurodeles waltl]